MVGLIVFCVLNSLLILFFIWQLVNLREKLEILDQECSTYWRCFKELADVSWKINNIENKHNRLAKSNTELFNTIVDHFGFEFSESKKIDEVPAKIILVKRNAKK